MGVPLELMDDKNGISIFTTESAATNSHGRLCLPSESRKCIKVGSPRTSKRLECLRRLRRIVLNRSRTVSWLPRPSPIATRATFLRIEKTDAVPANYKHASLTFRRACSDPFLMEPHGTWHRYSPR